MAVNPTMGQTRLHGVCFYGHAGSAMLDPEQVRAPGVPKRNRLSLLIVAWLFPGPLAAAPVYNAPTGLWLAPSNHAVTLYGSTTPGANWNVAQWNIPEDLPPFDAAGISRNRWARVAWLDGGRYELAQDASALSCEKLYPSGRHLVTEFDLLASPNNRRVPGFPQATAPVGPDLAWRRRSKPISAWKYAMPRPPTPFAELLRQYSCLQRC